MHELIKFLVTTKAGKTAIATPSVIVLFAFGWLAVQVADMRERLVRIETRLELERTKTVAHVQR